jgi:hypothetical protein
MGWCRNPGVDRFADVHGYGLIMKENGCWRGNLPMLFGTRVSAPGLQSELFRFLFFLLVKQIKIQERYLELANITVGIVARGQLNMVFHKKGLNKIVPRCP